MGGLALNHNVPLEIAHLVENLDAIAQAVAYIDQTVISDHHAVHAAQKYTTNPRLRLCLCCLMPPLAPLPSASNSMIGGAGVARLLSLGAGCPRVPTNTWSPASTQPLPTDPSTHPSGNGLGQAGSYFNCGTATLSRADACVMDTKVT